jgi:hypothetical protein
MGRRVRKDVDGGMRQGRQVFLCEASPCERQWHFRCPYCRKDHYHGAGEGHRNAHCYDETPVSKTGYYVVLRSEQRLDVAES